jgi:hypothetical protein
MLGAEIGSGRFGATVHTLLKHDGQPAALLREYRGFDQPDSFLTGGREP